MSNKTPAIVEEAVQSVRNWASGGDESLYGQDYMLRDEIARLAGFDAPGTFDIRNEKEAQWCIALYDALKARKDTASVEGQGSLFVLNHEYTDAQRAAAIDALISADRGGAPMLSDKHEYTLECLICDLIGIDSPDAGRSVQVCVNDDRDAHFWLRIIDALTAKATAQTDAPTPEAPSAPEPQRIELTLPGQRRDPFVDFFDALFGKRGAKDEPTFKTLHQRAHDGTLGKDLGIKEYRAYAVHLLAHPLVFHDVDAPSVVGDLVQYSYYSSSITPQGLANIANYASHVLDKLIEDRNTHIADAEQRVADLEAQVEAAKAALEAARKAGLQ